MPETKTKTRTITLSNRRPVKIVESDWPVIAKGSWCDTPALPVQANRSALVRVRQHADGRSIVYGTYDTELRGDSGDSGRKSGLLLDAGADIAAAIYKVVADLGVTATMAAECVADLPAEEL
jgi:hypothetical protein